MAREYSLSPWVESFQSKLGFGLQVATLRSDPDPSTSILAAGVLAEKLAFDAFLLTDHPAYSPECWVHLAVLTTRTRRIRLGSVVNCVKYRQPVMLARLVADVDNLSGGRLILGLGIGWDADEFGQLGVPLTPVTQRQQSLEEALEVIRGVWGSEPFTFEGNHHFTVQGHIVPPPVQRPSPPLIIGGAGEKVTLRQVAQYADACNFGASYQVGKVRTMGEVRHKLEVLRQHCDDIGRPYESILKSHFTGWLMLGQTEESAHKKMKEYYPEGVPEELRASRVIGTPESVIEYFGALADAGMEYFVVQVQDAKDHETIHLLATEVIPQLT